MGQLQVLAWGTAPIENGAHWSWFAKLVHRGLRRARRRLPCQRLPKEEGLHGGPGGQVPPEQGEEDKDVGPGGQGLTGPLSLTGPLLLLRPLHEDSNKQRRRRHQGAGVCIGNCY
jgi:hypothetical protein